ncbi:MAG: hypothetical protein J6N76_06455, partial [Lachnospiraceae bacterium]|nr:hypothetical protein [Lachnospiraceae bacterium]
MDFWTQRDIATLIIDFSTIVILGGIYYYSGVFRKRGLPEDKLFFAILIANALVAVTDVFSYIFDDKPIAGARVIATIGVMVYTLCFDAFFILFMQYAYAKKMNNEVTLKSWFRPILIPGYIMAFFVLINPFTGWIFYYDENAH